MKYAVLIQEEPGGQPAANLGVRVRRTRDGVSLATLVSDSAGLAVYERNGHVPPFFLETTNSIGGPRYWASDDVLPAGALDPASLPPALRALGDGVVSGYLGALAVSVSGTTISVSPGAALVAGHPLRIASLASLTVERPASGARIDRVAARVYPAGASSDPGYADVAVVTGTESAPPLVQTANEHQISLATVSVPAVGALTVTDERVFVLSGYLSRPPMLGAQARTSMVSTSSAAGEALPGLSVSLVLPDARTYDLAASLSAMQAVNSATPPSATLIWAQNVGSLGSGNGLFNGPTQVAALSDGRLWVADLANNRLQRLSASGLYETQLLLPAQPRGVAVDGSGNLYTAFRRAEGYSYSCGSFQHPKTCQGTRYWLTVQSYSSALALRWSVDVGQYGGDTLPGHLATDGTSLYVTQPQANRVHKLACATGGLISSWGSAGSGNGQFNEPYGLATDGATVWVGDTGNNRVQRFTSAGVYSSQFGSAGSGNGQFSFPAGLAHDSANAFVLATDKNNHRLQRFSGGVFVDSVGSYGSGDDQLNSPQGVAVAPNGDVWIADAGNNRLARYTVQGVGATAGGYGVVAVEIGGDLSPYLGPGQRSGPTGNAHVRAVTGPATVVVRAFGKATSETMTLQAAVLAASALPRG